MRRKALFAVLLFVSASLVFGFAGIYHVEHLPGPMLEYPDWGSYEKEWRTVDSLEGKGLTKSAFEKVTLIYEKAKKEENHAQVVKTLLYISKYTQQVEEDSFYKVINRLEDEIKGAKYPLKPMLQSTLASIYRNYLQNNYWRFSGRTETQNFDNRDIRTWDAQALNKKIIELFDASLENSRDLKRTKVGIYDDVLVHRIGGRVLRPTLYDFLAHRALDHFMNDQSYLTQPAYKFYLEGDAYFKTGQTFAATSIETKDTFSYKYKALLILQELYRHQQMTRNTEGLIDLELKRFTFVKNNSTLEYKDSLYEKGLIDLRRSYRKNAFSSWIDFELAKFYNQQANQYKRLDSAQPHRYDRMKALEICNTAISLFPNSDGGKNCKELKKTLFHHTLNVAVEKVNEPEKPFRASIQYRNVSKVYLKLVKLSEDAKSFHLNESNSERRLVYYLKQEEVTSWSVDLPETKDLQNHRVEISVPAQGTGEYILIAGTTEDFSLANQAVAYTPVWVSNLTYLHFENPDGSKQYFVLDRTSGHPIPGVKVQTWERYYDYDIRKYKYRKSKVYTTNENGIFRMPSPGKWKSRNSYLELEKNGETLFLYEPEYQYGREVTKSNFRDYSVFYTDRAIYRPGQTVYFKGLLMETDGEKPRIRPNTRTTVIFYDVNHQKISSLDLRSNEYGTVQGTFTAPLGVLTGQMYITDGDGSSYFSVEEYKRPKFEVDFLPVKESFRLNDKVKVEGEAKAYAGSSIDNAEVKFRVVRSVSYPYWWGRWYGYGGQSQEIAHGTTKTDADGKFEVEFSALPDLSIPESRKPQFSYTVHADVVDITGETHSAQTYVSVGYVALSVNLRIPESINTDKPGEYKIHTTNLNGEFEPASGTIKVSKLRSPDHIMRARLWDEPDQFVMTKEEYKKLFPEDIYKHENDYHVWEIEKEVFKERFDTKAEDTLRLKGLGKWKPGMYLLELATQDKYGEKVTVKKYFKLTHPSDEQLAYKMTDWYDQGKTWLKPGETASFQLGSSYEDVKAYYMVEHKGKIVSNEWVGFSNGKASRSIDIEAKHRGNLSYHLFYVKNGRMYSHMNTLYVPWDNKNLKIEFETWRDKILPGSKEEWRLKISGPNGEKVAAEMLATMYDASLDAFRANGWGLSIYPYDYARYSINQGNAFGTQSSRLVQHYWNPSVSYIGKEYESLNWFGYYGWDYYAYRWDYDSDDFGGEEGEALDGAGAYDISVSGDESTVATLDAPPAPNEQSNFTRGRGEATGLAGGVVEEVVAKTPGAVVANGSTGGDNLEGKDGLGEVKVRTNLNETAFFYPELRTNEAGEVILAFTAPEALTKWKVMTFAHTKDLKFSFANEELVTQKDLMVMPFAPRFLREGDEITFTAKVSNLTKETLAGMASLELLDAFTQQPLDAKFNLSTTLRDFSAKEGQSALLTWKITVPEQGIEAVTYRVKARSGEFTDGEESMLPVLTNRMMVTESMPLPVRAKETKKFRFDKLVDNKSTTLRHHKLTLEFTSNPAWYAIQALPYMMEYPYECAEQTFTRLYANSIATHIANSSPKIKAVFDAWRTTDKEALMSNLEKNQELKALLLEETPWVLQARDESDRKKRVGLLFDLNRMTNEQNKAIRKLEQIQTPNGGFPWFKGMPDNRYITQHIVCGFGHLDHLGVKAVKEDQRIRKMIQPAVKYMDDRIREDYEWLKKHSVNMEEDHIGQLQIHYLYARSYFKNIPVEKRNQEAIQYYYGQAKKYWVNKSRYSMGMISLALHRGEDHEVATDIIKSLKENAIYHEELGMYWKNNSWGYYWYQAPIETQALLIEAFDEVADDKESVNEMKVWLLKQKQTQDWKTTKATVEACYALLMRGADHLAESEIAEVSLGGEVYDPVKDPDNKTEAGTGYFKTSWMKEEIKPDMGNVKVVNKNEVVAWGAVYWQYFEQLDKITPHETPLKLTKKLFRERNTATGPVMDPVGDHATLHPGDKVKVRIELRVDRDMEYVHLKDMRGSCFEPVNVFSRYKWQDGLGYYEATKDASTNFFISYLRKGTYVFEYPLRVTHKGDFSNGITTIQCMYAPEFTSHSEGIRVKVE